MKRYECKIYRSTECVLQDLQSRNIPRISNECRSKISNGIVRIAVPPSRSPACLHRHRLLFTIANCPRTSCSLHRTVTACIRTLITNYLTYSEPTMPTTWRHRIACEIIGFDAHANVKTDTRPYVKSNYSSEKRNLKQAKKQNY